VLRFGGGLADAEAQGELPVEFRVCEIQIATSIEAVHEGLVESVATAVTEADEIQRSGRGELEILIGLDPRSELLGEFDVAADMMLQTFDAVVTNHKP